MQLIKNIKHGDTIIEVVFAFSVFAAVAIFSVNMMNSGLNNIQRTLETTMARNTIDSQADAIRFIHNNFLAERNFSDNTAQFQLIWNELKTISRDPRTLSSGDPVGASFDVNDYTSCEGLYECEGTRTSQIITYEAFVLNPRYIVPYYGAGIKYANDEYSNIVNNIVIGGVDEGEKNGKLTTSSLYPRIIYGTTLTDTDEGLKEASIFQRAIRAEGVWDIIVYSNSRNKDRSEYYDFYIRTCWDAAGTHTPSTITTIVRLYNPEMIE